MVLVERQELKNPKKKIPKTEKRIHLYGDSMKYFHSGLFGISNCSFGGGARTEEPQEKSPKRKKIIHVYNDGTCMLFSGLL